MCRIKTHRFYIEISPFSSVLVVGRPILMCRSLNLGSKDALRGILSRLLIDIILNLSKVYNQVYRSIFDRNSKHLYVAESLSDQLF